MNIFGRCEKCGFEASTFGCTNPKCPDQSINYGFPVGSHSLPKTKQTDSQDVKVIQELIKLCNEWSKGDVCIETCPMFWFCSEDRYIAWLKNKPSQDVNKSFYEWFEKTKYPFEIDTTMQSLLEEAYTAGYEKGIEKEQHITIIQIKAANDLLEKQEQRIKELENLLKQAILILRCNSSQHLVSSGQFKAQTVGYLKLKQNNY